MEQEHHLVPLVVRGRRVVVVGGGPTAQATVEDLLRAGADVLVVAAALTGGLERLAAGGEVATWRRAHRPSDLVGVALVHACTQDRATDDLVCADADAAGVLRARHTTGEPAPAAARRVLVVGGSRSGKSAWAEATLHLDPEVVYVATGPVPLGSDPEWAERVRRHQQRRPATWSTVAGDDLAGRLCSTAPASLLVDAVTTWLASAMDDAGVWESATGTDAALRADADAALQERVDALVDAWAAPGPRAVAVTDEVGCGIVPATPSGRRFRDELGRLNARLAACSDQVWRCTAGLPERLR